MFLCSCLQVEQVRLMDRFSNKSTNGTLYLTATHLIFVESSSNNSTSAGQEIWVSSSGVSHCILPLYICHRNLTCWYQFYQESGAVIPTDSSGSSFGLFLAFLINFCPSAVNHFSTPTLEVLLQYHVASSKIIATVFFSVCSQLLCETERYTKCRILQVNDMCYNDHCMGLESQHEAGVNWSAATQRAIIVSTRKKCAT